MRSAPPARSLRAGHRGERVRATPGGRDRRFGDQGLGQRSLCDRIERGRLGCHVGNHRGALRRRSDGTQLPRNALGGGVAAGAEGGVLLLTRPDLLSTLHQLPVAKRRRSALVQAVRLDKAISSTVCEVDHAVLTAD